jgi:hypothetical protein
VAVATSEVSASLAPLAPLPNVAKPVSGSERGPIAASPQRREALLIAARDAALACWGASAEAEDSAGSKGEEGTAREALFAKLGQQVRGGVKDAAQDLGKGI